MNDINDIPGVLLPVWALGALIVVSIVYIIFMQPRRRRYERQHDLLVGMVLGKPFDYGMWSGRIVEVDAARHEVVLALVTGRVRVSIDNPELRAAQEDITGGERHGGGAANAGAPAATYAATRDHYCRGKTIEVMTRAGYAPEAINGIVDEVWPRSG